MDYHVPVAIIHTGKDLLEKASAFLFIKLTTEDENKSVKTHTSHMGISNILGVQQDGILMLYE